MNMYEEDLPPIVATFKGSCAGVVIYRRSTNESHLCFIPICEDDGNWFVAKHGWSTYWLDELYNQMDQAYHWLENNCKMMGRAYHLKEKQPS